jgi:hypothetical protein
MSLCRAEGNNVFVPLLYLCAFVTCAGDNFTVLHFTATKTDVIIIIIIIIIIITLTISRGKQQLLSLRFILTTFTSSVVCCLLR